VAKDAWASTKFCLFVLVQLDEVKFFSITFEDE
jgi:hypothetical protein